MSDTTPPPYGAQQPAGPPPNHPRAVPALVLGILGLVLCGIFAAVPAYILGAKAEKEIAASGGAYGGAGLAKAGKILGLIGIVLTVLAVIFWIIVFATA